jgi:putative DNA primase/helicase
VTDARELTLALGGRWHGRYGTARCPAHGDRNPSLTIRDGESAPLLSCKAGCPREDVITALKARGVWCSRDAAAAVPWQPPAAKPKAAATVYWHTRDAPRETQRACDIWRDACGLFATDSPAGRYLIGRGIPPPWPETLAFGRLPHPETGEVAPTLIVARHCPVVGLVRGIQRIFLTEDGKKYSHGTVKMSLGSIAGGRAELIWPEDELLLLEGVESALSAWRLFRTPVWAICGGFPSELPLPQRVRSVQIIADHDPHGVSERNAKVLARSIRASGRACAVIMPNEPGADANDVLRGAA